LADASGPEPLRKVVLSRSLVIEQTQPIDVARLVRRLARDRSVWTFQTPLGPAEDGTPRVLVGATPELLVSRKGENVVSHPLAGSARRDADPEADRIAAERLQDSAKDRREHDTVVEAVLDTLAPYCRRLAVPDGTRLRATATMWHLGTRVVGTLNDRETPVAELLAALHPTPAVCGLPREQARDVIRQLEPFDRGFYAGAVGWTDSSGDGEWYVAIRCAEISGNSAPLFAGAGIVAGSDPDSEVEETAAKFAALLDALTTDDLPANLRGSDS
jgi:isochorismate synthase